MMKIAVVGLGWLGEVVALDLKNQGYKVVGTTTKKEKIEQLKSSVDVLELFDINKDIDQFESKMLSDSNVFIITIPPSVIENYADKLGILIDRIKSRNHQAKIIYCSSTSVYGSNYHEVTELSNVNPETENAKKIVAFEKKLISSELEVYILRLGGLVGMKRHPIKFLSGRKELTKGHNAVNLIHAIDIARLIDFIIKGKVNAQILNVCSPIHPTKKEYYPIIAKQLKITSPTYLDVDIQKDKVVICNLLTNQGFRFEFESPYKYPLHEYE